MKQGNPVHVHVSSFIFLPFKFLIKVNDIEIPEINEGVMAGDGPFKSDEEFQKPFGFPGEKVKCFTMITSV
jgi:hypothetical protein